MRITRRQSLYLTFAILGGFVAITAYLVSSERAAHLTQEVDPIDYQALPNHQEMANHQTQPHRQTQPTEEQTQPTEEIASHAATGTTSEAQRLVLKRFQRSETRDGVKVWEVTAERGEYLPASNSIVLTVAELDIFREGKPISIRADDARLTLAGMGLEAVELSGSVVLVHQGATRLETEAAHYSKKEEKVSAPGAVTIENSLLKVTGLGLEGDLESQIFTLKSDVRTVIKPREERVPVAKAAEVVAPPEKRKRKM